MGKEHLCFDLGETYTFHSDRFDRDFTDTKLDRFWKDDEAVRCVDVYGDMGWVVGYHKPIELQRQTISPYFWVIRDRDKALVGIQKCNLTPLKVIGGHLTRGDK